MRYRALNMEYHLPVQAGGKEVNPWLPEKREVDRYAADYAAGGIGEETWRLIKHPHRTNNRSR